MAVVGFICSILNLSVLVTVLFSTKCNGNDILGCGGFVKSHVPLDYSKIEIGVYTKEGTLKEKTECAPTNGYYFLPLYEKGEYVLRIHPPAGWSFEPSQVNLVVDGTTDQCSIGQDINFTFNGYGIAGRVITEGQKDGPKGISVQLVNEQGEVRDTVTSIGGDFHFTPVIPGKYVVKASHPRWKLDPAQAVVQVKEGNTALPFGVLAVKGYDVKGSVTSYDNPIIGMYVLLYSKQENPKYRVEGCNTALLQGVPDSPICHVVTDSSGEFTFGLVPAGEYRLVALAKPPGQAVVSFNVKPESVDFTVLHDSLYIKNAFTVTSFTVVGSVLTSVSGKGVASAQVLINGKPVATTDSKGKYTLPSLQPGEFTLSFNHGEAQFEDVTVSVSGRGTVSVPPALAARWRVCGNVSPRSPRSLHITGERGQSTAPLVAHAEDGKWCIFLPQGKYTAKVVVSEQEQKEGLQYYPLTQKILVGNGPVDGINFSQLKARVSGTVQCMDNACVGLQVSLKTQGQTGPPLTAVVEADGKYIFSNVLPGVVVVSVPDQRLCWREASRRVSVTQETAEVPPFHHTGYVVTFHSSHDIEVEYGLADGPTLGVLQVAAGSNPHCVGPPSGAGLSAGAGPDTVARRYVLAGRGCHTLQPRTHHVTLPSATVPTVHFKAIAHAVVLKASSPQPVDDLVFRIDLDGQGVKEVGPLTPLKQPNGEYSYEHTLYMADGETASVSAWSPQLLFSPRGAQRVVGRSACQPHALALRASPALTLRGRVVPPVEGVTVTLTSPQDETIKLTVVTAGDGSYSFGPLDASLQYSVAASKESFVFSAPDAAGDIVARRLAEISVTLLDQQDNTPLQGALVTVSGGSYRRNQVSGPDGRLRFGSLAPGEYFAKPLMKEYRFTPAHLIVTVDEGKTHHLELKGVRVAWSCSGVLVGLGGVGWERAQLLAVPTPASASAVAPPCALEEATTEQSGAFRIRGLLPGCEYQLQLKEAAAPDLKGLRLVHKPHTVQVTENKDIENVKLIAIQPTHLTDANVLVHTPNIDHYKTLRLTLTLETSPSSPLFTTKLDPAGYNAQNNPGLMYALPRLPADNNTYILQLESSLSKSTHVYEEDVHYFTSDGKFKYFNIEFLPKVRTSEQELRQSSFIIVPLLGLVALAIVQRDRFSPLLESLLAVPRARTRPERVERAERAERSERSQVLDKASIEHILSAVNAAGKKPPKKKVVT